MISGDFTGLRLRVHGKATNTIPYNRRRNTNAGTTAMENLSRQFGRRKIGCRRSRGAIKLAAGSIVWGLPLLKVEFLSWDLT